MIDSSHLSIIVVDKEVMHHQAMQVEVNNLETVQISMLIWLELAQVRGKLSRKVPVISI